jgi:hypothetical protein
MNLRLPDPDASCAVLIGCSRFEAMPPLPGVANNVDDLRRLLVDAQVWGLPPDRCIVVAEPAKSHDIVAAVNEAARRSSDTFLVYYAGHGLLDDHGELHLGIAETRDGQAHTALQYRYIKSAVQQHSRAGLNIVILDCCYSGRALHAMGSADALSALSGVDSAYVLTSSAANKLSMAPPGSRHTAFSGELIELIRDGHPGAGSFIDFELLFHHMFRQLDAKGLPLPQRSVRNSVADRAFVPNRAEPAGHVPRAVGRSQRPWPQLVRAGSGLAVAAAMLSAVVASAQWLSPDGGAAADPQTTQSSAATTSPRPPSPASSTTPSASAEDLFNGPKQCRQQSAAQPSIPEVTIKSPKPGTVVVDDAPFSGTARLARGQHLYFFFYRPEPICRYYLIPDDEIVPKDGAWESGWPLGQSPGYRFEGHAVVVDDAGHQALQKVLAGPMPGSSWNFARLPTGARSAHVDIVVAG